MVPSPAFLGCVMPSYYEVYDEGRTVLELWTGVVAHEEIVAQTRDQLQDTRILPGASLLVDATRARFETPAELVHEVSAEFGRPERKTSIVKHALLVNSAAWDRAQLLAREAEGFGVTSIVFTSLDIACQWLGLDPATARDRFLEMLAHPPG